MWTTGCPSLIKLTDLAYFYCKLPEHLPATLGVLIAATGNAGPSRKTIRRRTRLVAARLGTVHRRR
jgi:hypothetical protein